MLPASAEGARSDHLLYKDGTVDIPHWGVSVRSVFGAAAANHDIVKQGRLVRVTLNGVYIGTIQLADKREKERRERLHQDSGGT